MVLVLVQWRQLAVCVFMPSTIAEQQVLIHYQEYILGKAEVLVSSWETSLLTW
jgi:hypothetical protein